MKDLIGYIAKAVVDNPSHVKLVEISGDQISIFELRVAKEDLGKILVELEAKCPAALTRNAAEDEVDLNVDQITPAVMKEMSQFIAASQKRKKTGVTSKKAKTKA